VFSDNSFLRAKIETPFLSNSNTSFTAFQGFLLKSKRELFVLGFNFLGS